MENKKHGITWRSKTNYVDIETGEKLEKEQVDKEYLIIKKHKHATIKRSTGYITHTFECKRKCKQGELF